MLKRSLLIAGMFGLVSGAQAISVIAPATEVGITPQAVGAAGVLVRAPDFTITVTDDIDLNGKSLQLDFSAAPIAALIPTSLAVTVCADSVMADLSYAGVTNGGKTVNYTISGDNADPSTCVITGTSFEFAKAELTTAGITATSSFTIVGGGVSKSAAKVISKLTADQFKLTTSGKADEKINVNTLRKTLVGGASDVITFTTGDLGGGAAVNGVTVSTQEITVTGDFSWADNPLTAAFDPTTARQGQTPVAMNNGATYSAAKSTTTSLVFTDTTIDGATTLTLTPLVDANLTDASAANDVVAVAIPVQTYTISNKVAYTDEALDATGSAAAVAGSQSVAPVASGAWSLNGASTKIFSVPFGSEVESHSIFVSNKGASTGAITGSMLYAGNAPVEFSLGNVEAKSNKYLNIMGALEALGELPAFGRADVTLTVNSPLADITFTAGYTTAAGRANLFMEEQSNIATITNAASTSAASASTAATSADAVADVICSNLAGGADADGTAGGAVGAATKYMITGCP